MKRLLIFLLFLSSNCFAQEAVKNQIYVFDEFSGGLVSKISEFGLPKNYGTVVENARPGAELKTLTKRDEILSYGSADSTEAILGMHRLYLKDGTKVLIVNHGNEIETGTDSSGAFSTILNVNTEGYRWQWVTWQNEAIGTDGYNYLVKYDGSSATGTYVGSLLPLALTTGGGPSDTYTYKVTAYTTPSTIEVTFGSTSASVTVANKDVQLSMIPIGPDSFGGESILGRKIYRTATDDTTYYLLTTIADNSTTTYTDSYANGELSSAYGTPTATYIPPKGKYILVHKNRLFIAGDPSYPSRIYYSEDGLPDYFPATNYFNIRLDDGDSITFIKNLLGILTIGKNNTIQKLYTDGSDPSADWAISDPFSFKGCAAPYSAINSPLGIIYLGSDGIYKFNGQYSTLISDQVTPEIKDISPSNFVNCWGIFHNNMYYLAYTSHESGGTYNNRILIYDTLNSSYTKDLCNINTFCTFGSGTDWDTLYAGSSVGGTVYSYGGTAREILHKKHSDFSGTFTNARYIPTTAGGDADSAILELSRTETINSMSGTINAQVGDIDRAIATGTYVSPILNINSVTLDKLYWNENLSAVGDITFNIRASDSSVHCEAETWGTTDHTNSLGSDLSSDSAGDYLQYKINLETSDLDYTPTLYENNNYVIRLTYLMEGTTNESTVPFKWESGWLDFGYPGYKKTLRKIYCLYESESSGTLNITFENLEGETSLFTIPLITYPSSYTEYFSGGAFTGEWLKLEINESSLNSLKIKKIICIYDVEPLI